MLCRRHIQLTVITDDYQRVIDKNKWLNTEALSRRRRSTNVVNDHTAYLSYDDQMQWLIQMEMTCSFCNLQYIGTTYENRDIVVFSINNLNSWLPAVWIDANMEALEWITSASTLYIIEQIVTGTSANAIYMRSNYRFYIVANMNPDGYAYSFNVDRFWLKNRSYNVSTPNCYGVLLTRNFEVAFGGSGSSGNCASDNYRGSYAFSEAESSSVRDFIQSIPGPLDIYLTLHAYKQQWLIPWWYTSSKPIDYTELQRVAQLAALAINITNNYSYKYGSPSELQASAASGTSYDWAKASANIAYSYHVNMRPESAGLGGYDIPPENIIPCGLEIFNGITAVCREAHHLPDDEPTTTNTVSAIRK